jgi:hypothetical protein
MYIDPGLFVPRPSALRRDLGSRFELPKAQTIVVPNILVGFFGVEAVVNYDVQGGFLHDRDFSPSQEARRLGKKAEDAGDLRSAMAAGRELVRIVELLAKLQKSEQPTKPIEEWTPAQWNAAHGELRGEDWGTRLVKKPVERPASCSKSKLLGRHSLIQRMRLASPRFK